MSVDNVSENAFKISKCIVDNTLKGQEWDLFKTTPHLLLHLFLIDHNLLILSCI